MGVLGILHNNVAKGNIIYSQVQKKSGVVITIVAEKLAVGGNNLDSNSEQNAKRLQASVQKVKKSQMSNEMVASDERWKQSTGLVLAI
jgi:hypothetical protein